MSATKQIFAPVNPIPIKPTVALLRSRFVNLAGTGYCSADAKALGVTPHDYDQSANENGTCITSGIVWVQAGGEIAADAAVVSAASGKAVAATTLTATVPNTGTTPVTSGSAKPAMVIAGSVLPQVINGYAIDAAAADGDFIRIKLN